MGKAEALFEEALRDLSEVKEAIQQLIDGGEDAGEVDAGSEEMLDVVSAQIELAKVAAMIEISEILCKSLRTFVS